MVAGLSLLLFSCEKTYHNSIIGIWKRYDIVDNEINYDLVFSGPIKMNYTMKFRDDLSGESMWRTFVIGSPFVPDTITSDFVYAITKDSLSIISENPGGDLYTTTRRYLIEDDVLTIYGKSSQMEGVVKYVDTYKKQ